MNDLQKKYTCPILNEMMDDPVTTTCGHNFEGEALDFYLQHCSDKCPVCKKPIDITGIVRNFILRGEIIDYQRRQNPHLIPKPIPENVKTNFERPIVKEKKEVISPLEKQFMEITNCTLKEAKRFLQKSKDLQEAIELYFSKNYQLNTKQDVKKEPPSKVSIKFIFQNGKHKVILFPKEKTIYDVLCFLQVKGFAVKDVEIFDPTTRLVYNERHYDKTLEELNLLNK